MSEPRDWDAVPGFEPVTYGDLRRLQEEKIAHFTQPAPELHARNLEWHEGRHAWEAHGGYPRHQHSLNGALTIHQKDKSPHFPWDKFKTEAEYRAEH